MNMVHCGKDGMSPAVLTCRHIADGSASAFMRIPSPRDGDEMDDYLCLDCIDKGPEALTPDDLAVVCVVCLREAIKNMEEVEGAE